MLIIFEPKQLLTMNVLYYIPRRSLILQEFIWQYEDIAPKFLRTHKFLDYWDKNIEAEIKEVSIYKSDSNFKRVDIEIPTA
jgi:uncharacterized protein Usg